LGRVFDSHHIDAPPEVVWQFVWDATRRPEWEVGVIAVKDVVGPLDQVGGRWTEVRRGPFGITQEGTVIVTKVDPLHSFEVQREGEGDESTVTHTVTPENGGTRKTTESLFKFPGGVFGRIAEKVFAQGFIKRHSNRCEENVKALAEGRYPPHPTPAVERGLATPKPVGSEDGHVVNAVTEKGETNA
jgi:uncharacterized protein YndB with AHSA1/START domain